MKVQIVCYEDLDKGILGKFALKLCQELRLMSIEANIAKIPDPTADINHHIIYGYYNGEKTTIDTVMVTHIDTISKLSLLKKQLISAEMGICMSYETMQKLIIAGIPRQKLCYINPAHDGNFSLKKITIGITSRTFDDGRKNEKTLVNITKKIDPNIFRFVIMGKGWTEIVMGMQNDGFEVEYYCDFEYNKYKEIVPNFDYYLYFGNDEGSMGFIDALACGVQTIVTPQGYHLDAHEGITYPINNSDDIIQTFNNIAEKKIRLIRSVETWTWYNYAVKHLEIWEYLLKNREENYLNIFSGKFPDGITSIQKESGKMKNERREKYLFLFKLFKQNITHVRNNPQVRNFFLRR